MTIATYNESRSSINTRRRRLTGTLHRGPAWTSAVRVLRSAVLNAIEQAPWGRPASTANLVGSEIIDRIHELDSKSLHVLALTFSILVRQTSQHKQ